MENTNNSLVSDDQLWIGYDENGDHFKLDLNSLNRHMAVLGATGSGKTVLCKAVVEEAIIAGTPVIAVDPQGDIARLGMPGNFETLKDKNVPIELAKKYYNKCDIAIFTPGSDDGIKIIMDPMIDFPSLEDGLSPMEIDSLLGNISNNITTLFAGVSPSKKLYIQFVLFKILKNIFNKQLTILSMERLYSFIEKIKNDFETELELEDPLYTKEFSRLKTELNMLLEGPSNILFKEGVPLNIEAIISPRRGRTPLNIFYLNTLPSKELRQFFVAYLANSIYSYMLKTGKINSLLYIDEVKLFLPPGNVQTPSKKTLISLLEQGRKYNLKILLATQSPGKIDYQALSQTTTRCFGMLSVKQDLDKIKDLIEDKYLEKIPFLQTGQFYISTPITKYEKIHTRWLYTDHGDPIESEKLKELIDDRTAKFFLETVYEAFNREEESGDILEEKKILEEDLNIVRKETNTLESMKSNIVDLEPIDARDLHDILSIQRIMIIHRRSGISIADEDLGMLITKEAQLLSGFFTAITAMMKELKKVRKIRGRLEFREIIHESGDEGFIIWLVEGDISIVALLLDRRPSYKLQKRLKQFLMAFEDQYINEMKDFLGDISVFKDTKKIMEKYLGIGFLFPMKIIKEKLTKELLQDELKIVEFIERKIDTLSRNEPLFIEEIVDEGLRKIGTISYLNYMKILLNLMSKGILLPKNAEIPLDLILKDTIDNISKESPVEQIIKEDKYKKEERTLEDKMEIEEKVGIQKIEKEIEKQKVITKEYDWTDLIVSYSAMKNPKIPDSLLTDVLMRELSFDEDINAKPGSVIDKEFIELDELSKILDQFILSGFKVINEGTNTLDGPVVLFGLGTNRLVVSISKKSNDIKGIAIIMEC